MVKGSSMRYPLLILRILIGTLPFLGMHSAQALSADEVPQVLSTTASTDQVLDALHAAGKGLKDFMADVTLSETDPLNGDVTKLMGKVWYQVRSAADNRIRVTFDKKT